MSKIPDEQWKDAVLREARRAGVPAPAFTSDGDRGSSAIVWDDGPRNMHGVWIIDPELPSRRSVRDTRR